MKEYGFPISRSLITKIAIFLIFIFVFVAIFPILLERDFTPANELRYLSIADEAIRNNHFFFFTNQGEPYADKPPLFLWIVMLGKVLLGHHSILFLSLFSLLPAFIIAFVMDRWIAPHISFSIRVAALMMLFSTAMFIGSAVVIRMDMLMAMFIILALRIFFSMEEEENNKRIYSWLFPICVFMAIFTKGPIGLLIPLISTITYLLLTKRAYHIKRYWGVTTWVILLTLSFLWFANTYMEGGKEYLYNQLFHQTVGRAVNSFHHDKPFYYYLISFWYSLAPWSILIVVTVISGIRSKVERIGLEKFFMCIIGTSFLLLSLISSKLDIYMLPLFPFGIYMSVLWLSRVKNYKIIIASLIIPAIALVLALFADINLTNSNNNDFRFDLTFPAAISLTLFGIITVILLFRKRVICAIATIFMGIYISIFLLGWNVKYLNNYIGYGEICQEVKKVRKQYSLSDKTYVYKMKNAEDMDVYLGDEVITLQKPLDEYTPKGLIILPSKLLPKSLQKETIIIKKDPYTILVNK